LGTAAQEGVQSGEGEEGNKKGKLERRRVRK